VSVTQSSAAPVATPSSATAPSQVLDIDFHRGSSGEGNIIIQLSDPTVALDLNEQSGRIRLTFDETALPQNLQNRLDVIDFATPVRFIDAFTEDDNTVITIEPDGHYDYLAYQADNILTVSVKPLSKKEVEQLKRDRFVYTGEKLSLNFQDIEVRSVLQLIADFTDLNLVASDTVAGKITLRLQNVPWDQALDLVLKSKGLDKRKVGNVLMVAPADEIASRERQELENQQQIIELAPLFTDLMQINYADAAALADMIRGDGEASIGLLTERGAVQVVERTNSLLIRDTQHTLDNLRDLISEIDIPVKQVMIEARIVRATTDFGKELGVKWSGGKIVTHNDELIIGGRNTDFSVTQPVSDGQGNFNKDNLVTGLDGSNILSDLAVGNPAGALAVGIATDSVILNLEISALESDGSGEVISQPKVLTANNMEARIEQGQEIPFEEAASSGATSVTFKEAELALKVKPQITPDNKIIMKLEINNDRPDFSNLVGSGEPPIDTQQLETTVIVNDGDTIVLGGIFENTQSTSITKVPFLGDVPYVGKLFRKTVVVDDKTELLVFITPKIVDDAVTLR
jgi:type IV pilus assembly protein PilQ